ncbi:MAG: hypothetical protein HY729_12350 [Candidatus Rokubacteria bacterium]|nr:hypothetical protein [Candidatus Rokubacteria bacterium]
MLGMTWTLGVPWLVPLGGLELVLDPLGGFFVALVGVATVPASVYAIGDTRGGRRGVLAYLVFVLSMGAVPLAANMMTFAIAWELMSLASYFLVLQDRGERASVRAAWVYAVMTHAGLACLLAGMLLFGAWTGSLTFSDWRAAAPGLAPWARDVAFVLLAAGFLGKAGVIPLHVSETERGQGHQPPEVQQRADGGHALEVTLQVRPDVAVEPSRAFLWRVGEHRHREAADQRLLGPGRLPGVPSLHETNQVSRRLRLEQPAPGTGSGVAPLLGLRHRQQGEVGGTPREGLGHGPHQQQVRRTGQQEATAPPVLVDGALDGEQKAGSALDLVQRHAVAFLDQRLRPTLGPVEDVEIVQRPVDPFPGRRKVLSEGALAGLPGPGQNYDRKLPERSASSTTGVMRRGMKRCKSCTGRMIFIQDANGNGRSTAGQLRLEAARLIRAAAGRTPDGARVRGAEEHRPGLPGLQQILQPLLFRG